MPPPPLFFPKHLKFFVNLLSLLVTEYSEEDVPTVFIVEFKTLIAVGYTLLKSSSLSVFC